MARQDRTCCSTLLTIGVNRLIALNALSLAIAVIANLALLFNMARRLPFSIAQPITIVGWYISSFLLIGLLVAASHGLELPPGQDRALTQVRYRTWCTKVCTDADSLGFLLCYYGSRPVHHSSESYARHRLWRLRGSLSQRV